MQTEFKHYFIEIKYYFIEMPKIVFKREAKQGKNSLALRGEDGAQK